MQTCCICNKCIESIPNSALPLADNSCCDSCNINYVIPARVGRNLYKYKQKDELKHIASRLTIFNYSTFPFQQITLFDKAADELLKHIKKAGGILLPE